MKVIPGSHRQELVSLRENKEVESVLGSEADIDVDESQAVELVLSAGDVETHHPNIMHASANRSDCRRCGLAIRYIPTSMRIISDEQPWPSDRSEAGYAGGRGRNAESAYTTLGVIIGAAIARGIGRGSKPRARTEDLYRRRPQFVRRRPLAEGCTHVGSSRRRLWNRGELSVPG